MHAFALYAYDHRNAAATRTRSTLRTHGGPNTLRTHGVRPWSTRSISLGDARGRFICERVRECVGSVRLTKKMGFSNYSRHSLGVLLQQSTNYTLCTNYTGVILYSAAHLRRWRLPRPRSRPRSPAQPPGSPLRSSAPRTHRAGPSRGSSCSHTALRRTRRVSRGRCPGPHCPLGCRCRSRQRELRGSGRQSWLPGGRSLCRHRELRWIRHQQMHWRGAQRQWRVGRRRCRGWRWRSPRGQGRRRRHRRLPDSPQWGEAVAAGGGHGRGGAGGCVAGVARSVDEVSREEELDSLHTCKCMSVSPTGTYVSQFV